MRYAKFTYLIDRDDGILISKKAEGGGGAALIISGGETYIQINLYEGAMYELYNKLKAHVEEHSERPLAKNVTRFPA